MRTYVAARNWRNDRLLRRRRRGKVYADEIPFSVERIDMGDIAARPRKIMLTLADPDSAFERQPCLPNDGVGLARIEFIVSDEVQAILWRLPASRTRDDPATACKLTRSRAPATAPHEYFVENSPKAWERSRRIYPSRSSCGCPISRATNTRKLLGGEISSP